MTFGCQAEKQTPTGSPASSQNGETKLLVVDHQQFDALGASNESILILDVRTPREYQQGHVPGAINIPHNTLTDRIDEIAEFKDKPVVAYCESGGRTRMALDILKQYAFKNPIHLKGDMAAWRAAGRPIE